MLACLPWWLLAPAGLVTCSLTASLAVLCYALGTSSPYDRGYRDGWQAFLKGEK